MKTLLKSVIATAVLAAPSLALATTWEIDGAHSNAGFSIKHMMVTNVHGQFDKVTGTVNIDDRDITKSTVEATIDAASINTNEPKRDGHLKSKEFFYVEQYPAITFKSKKVEKAGEGKLKVTGDLTMRGVTKETVLDVELAAQETKDPFKPLFHRGATATTRLNRKDFGLNWNAALETGGVLVGDDVKVTLELGLKRDIPKAATAKDSK